MEELKEKLKLLPMLSGVYLMKNANGEIIYIGKAKALKKRVNQYFDGRKDKEIKVVKMVENIADFDYIVTNSEIDALLLEDNLVKKYKPQYNILLKDDKTFPYIKVNLQEKYPSITLTRKVLNDGAKYFGPYKNGMEINELLDLISHAYKVRPCNKALGKKSLRPCLNYDLCKCSAPCAFSSNELEKSYKESMQNALKFLNGDIDETRKILTQKMMAASSNLQYEQAILYREQLAVLDKTKQKHITSLNKRENLDVFGFSGDGELSIITVMHIRNGKLENVKRYPLSDASIDKNEALSSFIVQYYTLNNILVKEIVVGSKDLDTAVLESWFTTVFNKKIFVKTGVKALRQKLVGMANDNAEQYLIKQRNQVKLKEDMTIGAMKQLQEYLGLKELPRRMECFDISNISGASKVASMAVFFDGEKQSKSYRRFMIKTVQGANDFACMEEVLTRRLNKLNDENFGEVPNLIIVDGGAIQLDFAKRALEKLGVSIPIIALAERNEEIYTDKNLPPLILPKSTLAIKLLQRIRDEAHRFAVTYFRTVHRKNALISELEKIDGISKARAKALFGYFKTLNNIKNASIDELTKVNGISNVMAQKIIDYFNK